MAISPVTRQRLEIQGFTGIDDDALSTAAPWLRLAPALCAGGCGVGTVLAAPSILWPLALTAALGAAAPFHPFDLIYDAAIRRLTASPRLPANRGPRRFACAVGAIWLLATGGLFATGATVAGYVLGGAFVAVAGLVATTHICLPSMFYRAARSRFVARAG